MKIFVAFLAGVAFAVLLMVVAASRFLDVPVQHLGELSEVRPMVQAYDRIVSMHYPEPSRKPLVDGAIKGMIGSLKDPFSHYYTLPELDSMQDMTSGTYVGLGIRYREVKGQGLFMDYIQAGSPGEKAGIQPGDQLVRIDGAAPQSKTDAMKRLAGPVGQQHTLELRRDGRTRFVTLNNEKMTLLTVKHWMLSSTVGYISILDFLNGGVVEDFRSALQALQKQGMRALVVDVRDSAGGVVEYSRTVADDLLEEGVVFTRKNDLSAQQVSATPGRRFSGPLAVLVNRNTASASEIFAAAIQFNHRGVLVGQPTYGKHSTSLVVPLMNGQAMMLSHAEWLTPGGTSVKHTGLKPDVLVEYDRVPRNRSDHQMETAVQLLQNMQASRSMR